MFTFNAHSCQVVVGGTGISNLSKIQSFDTRLPWPHMQETKQRAYPVSWENLKQRREEKDFTNCLLFLFFEF